MTGSAAHTEHATIEVATGEVKVAKTPAVLQVLALGSCVAVILYDEGHTIGGIAHVMLPTPTHDMVKKNDTFKYANFGIEELVKEMRELGASEHALTARIVGGALVIPDTQDIGKNNIEAVRRILRERGIGIVGEYIGGHAGRSILFDVASGELSINGKVAAVQTVVPIPPEAKASPAPSVEAVGELEEKVAERTQELDDRVKELENIRKATLNLLEDLEKERENLAQTKARDEAILSAIGDGLVVVNKEGKVLFVNKSFEILLGWSESEILGKRMIDVIPQEDERGTLIAAPDRGLVQALKGTTITSTTTWYYVRKDKKKIPVAAIVTPVITSGGIIGAVEVFRDITKEKEIDHAKGEFVSLASHQLRTPMTGIKWVAEFLLKNEPHLSEHSKEYLNDTLKSVQSLNELIDQMLNVSRIEDASMAITPQQIDITALMSRYLEECKPLAEQKNITLNFNQKTADPLYANTDPDAVRSIIQSIVSNALEYTPANGSVTLRLEKNERFFTLAISDTGIGIPIDAQLRIFEKFARAENAMLMKPNGSGLGLYIAKQSCEMLGGRIWFDSKPDHGTTFYVELPLDTKPVQGKKKFV